MSALPIYGTLKEYLDDKEKIVTDNRLFKVHSKLNFYMVMIGLIFIFGENYLDSSKIICADGGDYEKTFCWLHGSGYVKKSHQKAGVTSCSMKQDSDWEELDGDTKQYYGNAKAPHTSYYVWLPFLLAICAALTKIPSVLWEIIESGKMKDILGFAKDEDETMAKKIRDTKEAKGIADRFRDQRQDFWKYHLAFGLCEVLNFVMVLASMAISNSLLRGMFWSYGMDVWKFAQNPPSAEFKFQDGAEDPRCNLFPTEVSCRVNKGAITGSTDSTNHLCLLNNNLFNQHYFAILWWWWVMLLGVSGTALIYRIARLASGEFSKTVLIAWTKSSSKNAFRQFRGTGADYFILGRIKENVSTKVMDQVVHELKQKEADRNDDGEMELEAKNSKEGNNLIA